MLRQIRQDEGDPIGIIDTSHHAMDFNLQRLMGTRHLEHLIPTQGFIILNPNR